MACRIDGDDHCVYCMHPAYAACELSFVFSAGRSDGRSDRPDQKQPANHGNGQDAPAVPVACRFRMLRDAFHEKAGLAVVGIGDSLCADSFCGIVFKVDDGRVFRVCGGISVSEMVLDHPADRCDRILYGRKEKGGKGACVKI